MITKAIIGVADLYKEVEEKGVAKIERYEFNSSQNPLYNLRAIKDGGGLFYMYDGEYIRLSINGELMMSDTNMERVSNTPFITNANGRVLIAGLGVGLIIRNILEKENITCITVIEKYQDVIDLVAPKFSDPRLEIICDDIFKWKPGEGEKFDTIYFDIWPTVGTDNLVEIRKLHNIFKSKLNRSNPKAWMNSWMKEYLQNERRKDRREQANNPWNSFRY